MNMLKKTTWLISGQVVGNGLAFVFYILLARKFGASDIGDYAFALSVAALFGLWIEFGFRPLLTRSVARDRASIRGYFGTVLAIQICLTLVVGLALHALSAIAGYSGELYLLLVFAFASTAINALAASFVAYLEAIEAMDKSALVIVVSRVTLAVVGFGLLLLGASLVTVMLAHVMGSIACLMMALYWVRRHFGPLEFHVDGNLAKRTLVAAIPFVLGLALYEVYWRVDIIMLHHMVGEAETGRYAVAFRLAMMPSVLAFVIGVAMYPTLSRSAHEDPGARDALFLGTLKWLAIFGMAGGVVLFSIGGPLLVLVFGEGFSEGAGLVQWMALLFFIHCVTVAYGRLVLAMNRESTAVRTRATAVVLNVGLNFWLIPRWGAYGAVWASVISEGIHVAILHFVCAHYVFARYMHRAGQLLFASAMAAAIGIALQGLVPWPVIGLLTLVVLTVAILGTGIVDTKDYRQLVAALRGVSAKSVNV